LFNQVCDDRAAHATLRLVGIVTYYGKHYSTFFFHSKLKTWIYFDDARVKEFNRYGPNEIPVLKTIPKEHSYVFVRPEQRLTSKEEILRLYDSKSDDYLRSPSHDSGIGSAAGSVSSTDTNHGGSDEDLIDYSLTLQAMRHPVMNGRPTNRNAQ
ncbi:predicted protein, partial [Nematostella vectensis]